MRVSGVCTCWTASSPGAGVRPRRGLSWYRSPRRDWGNAEGRSKGLDIRTSMYFSCLRSDFTEFKDQNSLPLAYSGSQLYLAPAFSSSTLMPNSLCPCIAPIPRRNRFVYRRIDGFEPGAQDQSVMELYFWVLSLQGSEISTGHASQKGYMRLFIVRWLRTRSASFPPPPFSCQFYDLAP